MMGSPRAFLSVALLLSALWLAAPAAQPDDTQTAARAAWMAGYAKLESAIKAENERNVVLALELYRSARDAFAEVQARYPAWNPSLLTYRVTYCAERIKRLESAATGGGGTLSQAELAALSKSQAEQLRTFSAENLDLRRQLELTTQALARARTEAARNVSAGNEVGQLLQEKTDLQTRLAASEEELRKRRSEDEKTGGVPTLKETLGKLQQRLDLATNQNTELEKAAEGARRDMQAVTAKLRDASLQRETLATQNQGFQAQLQQARKQVAAQAEEMAALRARVDRLVTDGTEGQKLRQTRERERAEAEAKAKRATDEAAELRPFRDRFLQTSSENQDLRAQQTKLAADLTEAQARTARLQEQTSALAREGEGLRAQLAKRQDVDLEVTRAVAATKAELQAQLAEAEARCERLGRERDELSKATSQAGGAAADPTPLQARCDDLARQLAEAVRRNAELGAAAEAGPGVGAADLARDLTASRNAEAAAQQALRDRDTLLADLRRRCEDLAASATAALADKAKGEEAGKLNDDLQARLAKADEFRRQQETALASAKTRLDQLAAVEKLLQQRESEARDAAGKAEELQRTLTQALGQLTQAQASLTDREAQVTRLEKTAADLREQLAVREKAAAEATRDRDGRGKSEQALREQLQQTAERLAAEQQNAAQLKTTADNQLGLLRKLDQSVRNLEGERTALQGELKAAQGALTEQVARAKELETKTQVVDGLAASLSDTDATLARARESLAKTTTDLEHARSRAASLGASVGERDKTILGLRDLLSQARAKPETADAAVAEQARSLARELEAERERTRSLQAALEKRDRSLLELPPIQTATPPSGDSERDRREREKAMLIRGFLRQGTTAEQQGNREAAVWNYQKVIEHDATGKLALQRLGLLAAEAGNDDEAIRYLRRAFYADPDDPDTLLPLGFALVRRQQADLAVSMLSRAAALDPANAAVHRSLGIACSSLGWTDAAEAQLRRAYALDGQDRESAFNLAVLLATRQPAKLDEAKEWYQRARKLGAESDPGLDKLFGL